MQLPGDEAGHHRYPAEGPGLLQRCREERAILGRVIAQTAYYDYFDVSPQRKIFSKETISQKMRDSFRSYSRKHAQYLIVLSDFRTFPFLCSFFSSQILTC